MGNKLEMVLLSQALYIVLGWVFNVNRRKFWNGKTIANNKVLSSSKKMFISRFSALSLASPLPQLPILCHTFWPSLLPAFFRRSMFCPHSCSIVPTFSSLPHLLSSFSLRCHTFTPSLPPLWNVSSVLMGFILKVLFVLFSVFDNFDDNDIFFFFCNYYAIKQRCGKLSKLMINPGVAFM